MAVIARREQSERRGNLDVPALSTGLPQPLRGLAMTQAAFTNRPGSSTPRPAVSAPRDACSGDETGTSAQGIGARVPPTATASFDPVQTPIFPIPMRRLLFLPVLAAASVVSSGCAASYPALDEAERAAMSRERDSLQVAATTAEATADSLVTVLNNVDQARRRPGIAVVDERPAERPADRPAPRPMTPAPRPATTPVPPARDPGIREPDGPPTGSANGPAMPDGGRRVGIAYADSMLVDDLFTPATATLSDVGKAILDRLAYEISRLPETARVRVEGHADATPPGPTIRERFPTNWELAAARAAAVARYLSEKGLAETRLEVVSFGSTRPIAPNDTPQNRSRNRRIVVLAG